MLLRLYQTECLPIRARWGHCKLVEALYTAKPILHWFIGSLLFSLCIIAEACLQMRLRLYQTEFLPIWAD